MLYEYQSDFLMLLVMDHLGFVLDEILNLIESVSEDFLTTFAIEPSPF